MPILSCFYNSLLVLNSSCHLFFFLMIRRPPRSTRTDTLFPYTTLFRSVLVENKAELMRKLGKKQLTLQLLHPLRVLPKALAPYQLELAADGNEIVYTYDSQQHHNDIADLFKELSLAGIRSAERRVGTGCVSTCSSRWSPSP